MPRPLVLSLIGAMMMPAGATQTAARPAYTCGGFAMLGGAQLLCSHVDPEAPPQECNFSWTLMGPSGPTVVAGAFVLPTGIANSTVYQGSGFAYALTSPIVLCQSRQTSPGD